MQALIIEITELYNSKDELLQLTIVLKNNKTYRCFEQLPKKAKKWLERAKREATYINESKTENWTRKIYRKEMIT